MIGELIVMFIFVVFLSLTGGVLLGHLFWTPPTKGVK